MRAIRSEQSNKSLEALIYILGWFLFSLSISIYNKWMFGKGLDFKFPIFITSFHQFCLMLLSCGVLYFNPKLRPTVNVSDENANDNLDISTVHSHSTANHESFSSFLAIFKIEAVTYLQQIFPCSLASAGDIGLSNVSFKFVSLSLYTMLKTSALIFVLLFGLLFRLEKFHWRLVVIVLVMTGSVMMMVKRPGQVDPINDDHSGVGILLVLGASMMSGLRWSLTQILLKRNEYTNNSILTIFYISPSMCSTLFIFAMVFEGWSDFTSSPIWESQGIFGTIGLMTIPGVLAFMMTLCEFKLLSVAQVVTLSIAGIFKELLTIVLGSIIFGDKLSFINCIGLVVTFMDILWYNYFRYKENQVKSDSEYTKLDNEEGSDVHVGRSAGRFEDIELKKIKA